MPVADLKSKDAIKRICWALDAWRREREPLEIEHAMISKYHQRLWFQEMRRQSLEELLAHYYQLARSLDDLDKAILEYERLIYLHNVAREELHTSMNPFKGIDLKETTLVQTSLF